MKPLADWLSTLGTASLDIFWLPLLAWTALAFVIYLGLRCWRKGPALVQYHAHLALLLALPLSALLAPLLSPMSPLAMTDLVYFPEDQPIPDYSIMATEISGLPLLPEEELPLADAVPVLAVEEASPFNISWSQVLGFLTVAALGLSAFLLARMAYLTWGLYTFQRTLSPVQEPRVYRMLDALTQEMNIPGRIALRTADSHTTPMTFGWRRPVIVLPSSLLTDEVALRMTLIHELIHIRRHDYAVSWVVRLTCCLFAIHPGVWLLQRRIEQFREISCDAEAVAGDQVNVRQYVELLLRFSPLTDLAGPTALRMVELDSTLKQRIHAMKEKMRFTSSTRRFSIPLALGLLLIPTLFAACISKTNSETVHVTSDAVLAEDVAQEIEAEELLMEELEMLALREQELALRQQELNLIGEEMALRERVIKEQKFRAEDGPTEVVQAAAEAEAMYREALALRQQQADLELLDRSRVREGAHLKREFQRLEIEMEYLKREVRSASETLGALMNQYEVKRDKSMEGEIDLTRQRYNLLRGLYSQRLEQYELLKMQLFTQKALGKTGQVE